jgi:tight adherence protein B
VGVVELLAAILVFIAVAALVYYILTRRGGNSVESRLERMRKVEKKENVANVLKTDTGTFPLIRRFTGETGWGERARVDLAQAGLTLKPSEYLLIRLFAGVMIALIMLLIFSGSSLLLFIVLGAAVFGFMLPGWYVGMRKTRRKDKIAKQLPEAVSLIANSLRSGFAFSQAMELASLQIASPIKEEFGQYLSDTSLGSPSEQALESMAERVGTYDMDMLVSTILIQRTTGGNLSEILDNVAETIRERERLHGEIRALTSSQRFAGFILSIYPMVLLALFTALAPDIWTILFKDPTGRIVLGIAIALQVIGIISIRRLLRLEV